MINYRLRRVVGNVFFYLLLGVFMLIVLLPIYYIFLTAFAPGDQLFTKPLSYLPRSLAVERFQDIFNVLADRPLYV